MVAGKTVGSKVIAVGFTSVLAALIAALRVPGPESAALVTTIAQETEAPSTRENERIPQSNKNLVKKPFVLLVAIFSLLSFDLP
jgi:hypothetical protein